MKVIYISQLKDPRKSVKGNRKKKCIDTYFEIPSEQWELQTRQLYHYIPFVLGIYHVK